MVKAVGLIFLAISCVSCAGALPSQDMRDLQPAGGSALPAPEDRELTSDEFEALEGLKENPIDPRGADLDALRSIPDFPERLAKRVVEATAGAGSGRTWIERLTPPEREELYGFREYLVLPRISSLRCSGRFTEESVTSGEGEEREGRVAVAGRGVKVLLRGKQSGNAMNGAWYLSASALSSAVRMHAGSFAPDFAMGLLFGGSAPSYLFGSSYPRHAARSIVGTTSFYGPAVFGGAVELWYRRAQGVLVFGRPRIFRSTHFDLGPERVAGARFVLRLSGGEFGLSGFGGASRPGTVIYAIDGAWGSRDEHLMFELGFAGQAIPAWLLGISSGTGGTRVGFLFHSIPSRAAGSFARVDGNALRGDCQYVGGTVVVERTIVPRLQTRAAIECFYRTAGVEDERKELFKAECEKRWTNLVVRLSWSRTVSKRQKCIPYPAESEPVFDETGSLCLNSSFRFSHNVILKLYLRAPLEDGIRGLLVSPTLTLRFFSRRLETVVSGMSYWVFKGRPVCYYYEPSLAGTNPWRAAWVAGERSSLLISYKFNWLALSCKATIEGGKPPVASLQAAATF
jgi:hypothetical protein